jgi:UDP-N-acetyl-D-glucosamine dehydrogenase
MDITEIASQSGARPSAQQGQAMSLHDRIDSKSARVAIIGQGYVGLPLALELARSGFKVAGIDTDHDRVASLNQGKSHIPDAPSELLTEMIQASRFLAKSGMETLSEQDVIVICVPTPLRKSKDPDISYVVAAADEVARHLHRGQLIILESTTYPGTTEELLLPMFQKTGLKVGEDFYLAFSPERIDPGNANFKVKDIPKLVGGVTPECARLAAVFYHQIVAHVSQVSSPIVAEVAKLYENTFRGVNIALANELALMCHHLGVSVWEVLDAAATKPFGFLPFYPGPGIGGHCIPVDPMYLSWKVRLNGYEAKFIGLADEINRAMPRFVVRLLTDALNELGKPVKAARILVLGVAYKRGVGDIRESPAIEIIDELLSKGAHVQYSDPFVPTLTIQDGVLVSATVNRELLRWSDAALIVTDHRQFDYELVVGETPLIVDTRNATRGIGGRHGRIIRL